MILETSIKFTNTATGALTTVAVENGRVVLVVTESADDGFDYIMGPEEAEMLGDALGRAANSARMAEWDARANGADEAQPGDQEDEYCGCVRPGAPRCGLCAPAVNANGTPVGFDVGLPPKQDGATDIAPGDVVRILRPSWNAAVTVGDQYAVREAASAGVVSVWVPRGDGTLFEQIVETSSVKRCD